MLRAAFVLSILLISVAHGVTARCQDIYMVTEVSPPFQVYDNNVPDGLAVEMATQAARKAGLTYTISVLPWSKAYNIAQTGTNVCIFSIVRSKEREAKFKWASMLATANEKVYRHRTRRDITVESLEDAKRYRIVVARDDVTHAFLLSKGFAEGENLVVVDDTPKALRLLASSDTVDLMLLDSLSMPFRASEAGLLPSRIEPVLDIQEMAVDLWVAFSLDTPDEVVVRFRKAMDELKASGAFEKARIKWNLDR